MNAKKPTRAAPRKLLVAALGVATVNYVVACGKGYTSGNLPAPQPEPSVTPVVGNLPSPPPPDAGNPPPPPTTPQPSSIPPTSGNLPAPVPQDAAAPKTKTNK